MINIFKILLSILNTSRITQQALESHSLNFLIKI